MSFILDALKKSETERQNRAGAGISITPRARQKTQLPGWAIALMGTLGLAVIGLGWAWWQAQQPAPPAGEAAVLDRIVAAPAGGPVRDLAAEARALTAKPEAAPPTRAAQTASAEPQPESAPAPRSAAAAAVAPATLPTRADLTAQGITLPEMNLDIHVYSSTKTERFVFINSSKYREGERLRDGPRVQEITADGVILSHQGVSFLLPRD